MFKRLFFVSLLSFSFGGALQGMYLFVVPAAEAQEKQPITHTCVCSLDAAQKQVDVGHMKLGEEFEFREIEGDIVTLIRGVACLGHVHVIERRVVDLTQTSATSNSTGQED